MDSSYFYLNYCTNEVFSFQEPSIRKSCPKTHLLHIVFSLFHFLILEVIMLNVENDHKKVL